MSQLPQRTKLGAARPTAPPASPTPQPARDPHGLLPPPVGVPGGILPPGRPMAVIAGAKLSAFEREQLAARGIDPDKPLPGNTAEIIHELDAAGIAPDAQFHQQLAAARRAAQYEIDNPPSPVPPDTPPVELKIQPIESLSPEQQNKYQDAIDRVFDAQRQAEAAAASATTAAKAAPGVAEATRVAQQAAGFQEVLIEDDRANPPTPSASPTGAAGGPEFCPHCQRPVHEPSDDEPSAVDKSAFLQSVIGQVPFIKQFSLLGGALKFTFRTLTMREQDAIYASVTSEAKAGQIQTHVDFRERTMRYRLFLSLSAIETSASLLELPDGLRARTNPKVDYTWENLCDLQEPTDEALLAWIEEYVNANLLGTESLIRLAGKTAATFERLYSKLEVLSDNENFWKATAPQS